MPNFRKKPVVVEAVQFNAIGDHPAVFATAESPTGFGIMTLEHTKVAHEVTPGDWIITGVKGEYYACKPDIFDATYEAATIPSPAQEPVEVPAGFKLAWVPDYPEGDVIGPCICGSWPGGKCLRCPVQNPPAAPVSPPAESGEVGKAARLLLDLWNSGTLEDTADAAAVDACIRADETAGMCVGAWLETLASTPAPQPCVQCMHGTILGGEPNDCAAPDCPCAAPQPGGAVKVKALEWRDREGVHPRYVAAAITGDYFIDRTKGGAFSWWTAALRGKVEVHTLDAAKAAAQADYERRILSALSPSPSGWDAGAARGGWMLMNDNGKRWRICGPAGRWIMKPEGAITADEARTICETAMGTALPLPTPPAVEG